VTISDEDAAELLSLFPNLKISPWKVTSSKAATYNCIGWAMQETRNWWPIYYYWPPGAERTESVAACRQAFESRGFEACQSSDLEPGFVKVAIYAQGYELTHAARQLPSGTWTSKLGLLEDIGRVHPLHLGEDASASQAGKAVSRGHISKRDTTA